MRYLPTGAIGRCDRCFRLHPPAMALQVNGHRVEYPQEIVDAMPRNPVGKIKKFMLRDRARELTEE